MRYYISRRYMPSRAMWVSALPLSVLQVSCYLAWFNKSLSRLQDKRKAVLGSLFLLLAADGVFVSAYCKPFWIVWTVTLGLVVGDSSCILLFKGSLFDNPVRPVLVSAIVIFKCRRLSSLWGPFSGSHMAQTKLHICTAVCKGKKRQIRLFCFEMIWSSFQACHWISSWFETQCVWGMRVVCVCTEVWVPAWSFGTIRGTSCSRWTSWRAVSFSLSFSSSRVFVCV